MCHMCFSSSPFDLPLFLLYSLSLTVGHQEARAADEASVTTGSLLGILWQRIGVVSSWHRDVELCPELQSSKTIVPQICPSSLSYVTQGLYDAPQNMLFPAVMLYHKPKFFSVFDSLGPTQAPSQCTLQKSRVGELMEIHWPVLTIQYGVAIGNPGVRGQYTETIFFLISGCFACNLKAFKCRSYSPFTWVYIWLIKQNEKSLKTTSFLVFIHSNSCSDATETCWFSLVQ